MKSIRFYGEGKADDDRQMFLSECGIFHYATRKELVKCYRTLEPMRHVMVYLYSREEYDRNRKNELAKLDKAIDTWYDVNIVKASNASSDIRRELGFDFEKDNGIER